MERSAGDRMTQMMSHRRPEANTRVDHRRLPHIISMRCRTARRFMIFCCLSVADVPDALHDGSRQQCTLLQDVAHSVTCNTNFHLLNCLHLLKHTNTHIHTHRRRSVTSETLCGPSNCLTFVHERLLLSNILLSNLPIKALFSCCASVSADNNCHCDDRFAS